MSDLLDRPAPPPDEVLRYADHADGVVDLYLPEEPALLVVHLHGGFWRQAYDRGHARPLARALQDAGVAVALPEYRRVGGGGGWPQTCEDVRRAYDAVTARFGALPVTLSGHSAGGHLALWLTATGAGPTRTVPIAPVGDLRDALATRMGDGAAADFLGTDRPVDAADPAVLLSPGPLITVLHGTADEVVPIANSRGLVARHPWIDLVPLEDVDHFDPVDPGSAAWPAVRTALAPSSPGPRPR